MRWFELLRDLIVVALSGVVGEVEFDEFDAGRIAIDVWVYERNMIVKFAEQAVREITSKWGMTEHRISERSVFWTLTRDETFVTVNVHSMSHVRHEEFVRELDMVI